MALSLKLKLKPAAEVKPPSPPAVTGPYRAAHTPGRPDNEWEVRDGDGLLVQQVIGGDFEAARKRCFWLAGKLNQAYDAGRRDGQRDTKRRV